MVSKANKLHLENKASQIHNRLPASSKAALDSFVIFLNLYKHLVSLSQTNRTLCLFVCFCQFFRMHAPRLHSCIRGSNLSFPELAHLYLRQRRQTQCPHKAQNPNSAAQTTGQPDQRLSPKEALDCPAGVPRQPHRDPHPRRPCITTQALFNLPCPPEFDPGQALNPVPWRHFLPNQPETKHAPEVTVAARKETLIKVTTGTDQPALLSR